MSRRLQASLLAAAVALSAIPLVATTAPATAQVNFNVSIGFDHFYDGLSPYGDWNYHPRWGDVWRPSRVGADFRPYFRGYWVNTEYGMTFNSEEPWGDLTYHYGRWVYDPYDGWLWVPGYTWAPAWVVWRGDARNIGWFPMPPDDRFLAGVEVYRDDWDWNRGYFGYSDWYGPSIATGLLAAWTFVALDRFADRDYYRYVQPRTQVINIVNNTTNITNYVTVNNRIVNRSVDVAQVERASGRRIERVQAERVVRGPITTVETGRQVQVRERERHGGDVRAPARERVERLTAQEARVPVRERRQARFQRGDQQQAQQPLGQQPQAQQAPEDRGGRFERNQQREQQKAEPRGRVDRDKQGAVEPPQPPDRGAAIQQQREEQQRARIERDRQGAIEQQQQPDRGAAVQHQREEQQRARIEQDRARADQQNRAAAERQQRDQAEQQNRARAEQQQNRGREGQAVRAQQAERQQQLAEQQNRARAQQAERQQQQQAAAEERQQRAKAKQQKEEEEEKDRKAKN